MTLYRLLRRAMDGCDLHGGGPRHAGPGAGTEICLRATRRRLQHLIDILVDASADYLSASSKPVSMRCRSSTPGRDRCRRTNSSAGALQPTKRIVARNCAPSVPGAKIIGFPRGAGKNMPRYAAETGVDAVGLERMIDRDFAREQIQIARAGAGQCRSAGIARRRRGARPRASMRSSPRSAGGPLIFNLGHGILPDTPIAHVEQMLKRVRGLIFDCHGRACARPSRLVRHGGRRMIGDHLGLHGATAPASDV